MDREGPKFRIVPPPPAEPPPPRFSVGDRVIVRQRRSWPYVETMKAYREGRELPSSYEPRNGTVVGPLGNNAIVKLDDGGESTFYEDELESAEDGPKEPTS